MRKSLLFVEGLAILALIMAFAAHVAAYNYDLDVDPDSPVLTGTTVTATAGTDDPSVDTVKFAWTDPDGIERLTQTDTVFPYTSSCTVDKIGEWEVEARFKDGTTRRATIVVYFFVIPELPLGVATALTASLAGLGALRVRRKKP